MPKAILITEENRERLEGECYIDPDGQFEDCEGLYLVLDFGGNNTPQSTMYGVLSKDVLMARFTKTRELERDWFEVVRNEKAAKWSRINKKIG